MENVKNVFLYLSAFLPMYFLILLRQVLDLINHNLSFNVLNGLSIALLVILMICGWLGLWLCIKKNVAPTKKVKIICAKNITDQHFLGYFSLFVLFALQLDIAFVSDFFLFIVITIFIGIVYIKNSLYYINPLLNLLGYSFYDIDCVSGQEKIKTKIFYKGKLDLNKNFYVKIKNENFAFIDKKRN